MAQTVEEMRQENEAFAKARQEGHVVEYSGYSVINSAPKPALKIEPETK